MSLGQDVTQLLHTYGYAAVFVFPLLESTGIPVPGETMLLTAAVYAATTGRLNIAVVIACAAAGAITGDNFGYLVGRKGGRALILRYGRHVRLGEKQLRLGERFFERHGDKTVFLARFVALLRTMGAFLAGTSAMRYRNFFLFNMAGGIAWATLYGLLAFALGKQFERYRAVIERFGVAIALLVVIAAAAFLLFGRKRFERWAVGEDSAADPP
ncbi:MAG: DedA family protein [Candidatus Dormibacteria bacterium]